MSKHTPGPWRKQDRYVMAIVGGQEILIATPDSMDVPDSQVMANARLMAAAPELLAACKEALQLCEANGYGRQFGIPDRLRAAIAKAEGN